MEEVKVEDSEEEEKESEPDVVVTIKYLPESLDILLDEELNDLIPSMELMI